MLALQHHVKERGNICRDYLQCSRAIEICDEQVVGRCRIGDNAQCLQDDGKVGERVVHGICEHDVEFPPTQVGPNVDLIILESAYLY